MWSHVMLTLSNSQPALKMESLVKLCAESLHFVLLGLCTSSLFAFCITGRAIVWRRFLNAGPIETVAAAKKAGGAHGPYGDAEQKLYLESTVLERKVPEADLRHLVDLPPGLDLNEWLASHTIAFFEHVNLLYGAVSEYCTPGTCPDMLGPGQRQYHWIDERGKKIRLAAPQYIDYVMTYAQRTVNDEAIFPTKFAHEFPGTYEQTLRKIQRLLFHVVAHLYHRHFRELLLLGLHGHLHALFAHLMLFNRRFRLIDDKETEVLSDLVTALRLQPCDEKSAAPTTPRSGQPSPTPLPATTDAASASAADGSHLHV
nr:EOG090X0E0F [Moina brachiata]